jgi:hypothetical protein
VIIAVEQVLLLCAFRALPFALYTCVSTRVARGVKWTTGLLYLALVAGTLALRSDALFAWCLLGTGYYLLCGCLVPASANALRRGQVTPLGLFVGFGAVYLLIPGVALPDIAHVAFLVLGWELLLSSYSYCCDVARGRHEPALSDCLFFLFVNPTLVYSKRGRVFGEPRLRWPGVNRALLGVASMLLAAAILRPAYAQVLDEQAPPAALAAGFGVLRFLAEYAAHSGLASIQIGLLMQVGYQVPERYHFPFMARDPLDFWRRWNTYVGSWLKQYVFVPLARRWSHGRRGATRGFFQVTALMLTFVASGLLHDGFSYAGTRELATRALEFFLASGAATLVWLAAGRVVSASTRREGWAAQIASVASRVCFLIGLLAACVVWG